MSANTARCPRCDHRHPTPSEIEHALNCKDVDCTAAADACWGDGQCENNAADWRQRAMDAEKRAEAAEYERGLATSRSAVSELDARSAREQRDRVFESLRSTVEERDAARARAEDAARHLDCGASTPEPCRRGSGADTCACCHALQLSAERDAARRELEQARATLADVREWTHVFGAALKPPGPDTYGNGMRDAKEQVERRLAHAGAPLLAELESLRALETMVRARAIATTLEQSAEVIKDLGGDDDGECRDVLRDAEKLTQALDAVARARGQR